MNEQFQGRGGDWVVTDDVTAALHPRYRPPVPFDGFRLRSCVDAYRAACDRDAQGRTEASYQAVAKTRERLMHGVTPSVVGTLMDSRDAAVSLLAIIEGGNLLEITTAAACMREMIVGPR